ncbi:MAG: AI-2E family transporter [Thermomicrobiales bacterium]
MESRPTAPAPVPPDELPVAPDPLTESLFAKARGITPIALLLVLLLAYFLIEIKAVLMLIIIAYLFGTIIERPVNHLQRRHLPRGLSILLIYAAIIACIAVLVYVLAPTISQEADIFRREAPDQLRELQGTWRSSDNGILSGPGVDGLQNLIEAIQRPPDIPDDTARGLVFGVTGGLLGVISVFVITFYYLMEKDFTRSLLLMQFRPSTASRIRRTLDNVDQQLGRWMRGQLTLCLIIGITSTIAYGLLDVRFWPVLGLIAGVTEAIPIIGPWIGGIPAVAMALTQSWEKALMVAGVAIAIQFTENWVLVPRVMKGAVGLTPLTVFLALLVGTEFMGVIGALLAIPIAAAIQVIVSEYIRARREGDNIPATSNWRWLGDRHFLGRTTRPPTTVPPPASPYTWPTSDDRGE